MTKFKLYAYLFAITACLSLGWYSHTVWDGYKVENTENKAITSLGEGEVKIFKFNGELDKVKASVKDDCLARPIPASISLLLK